MVTGKYDLLASDFGIRVKVILEAGMPVNTECAHIVPESTYFDCEGAGSEKKVRLSSDISIRP